MATYVFSVDSVEVHNVRSKDTDSDWLSLVWTVGQQVFQKTYHIGSDIHSGDLLKGPWQSDPVEITDTDHVTVTCVITNLSHTDAAEQEGEAIKITATVVSAVVSVVGAIVTGGAGSVLAPLIFAAVGGAVSILGEVLGWVVSKADPNCNGEVLRQTFEYLPGELKQEVGQAVANEYTLRTPSECGEDPHTKMTFSAINPASLKQFLVTHEFNPSRGVQEFIREFRPGISSMKTLMGL